jgi:predicted Zn-dependent protease with MMP-like domain
VRWIPPLLPIGLTKVFSARGLRNFERLVGEALESLPEDIAEHMSNVDVVVEDYPDDELVADMGEETDDLLGIYRGIPLTDRSEAYFGVLPDRISLYKRNIERAAGSRQELKEIVRRTVIHEVAHHFGLDDDRLEELGWS